MCFSRFSIDQDDLREIGEAAVLNTRFAVPFNSFSPFDGEIYVSAENLTNTGYEYYPGYPMSGIMWYVGCKFKF